MKFSINEIHDPENPDQFTLRTTMTPHPRDRIYIDPTKIHIIDCGEYKLRVLNSGWIAGYEIHWGD
jgi:hypothetical protein